MSISSALSNALSGLTASSGTAQVIASNIANALTPGYAPRSIELSARSAGSAGGVAVAGMSRRADPGVLSARRAADGTLAEARVANDFQTEIERLVGTPDQPESLPGRLVAFEASLVTAAAKPEEESRLRATVQEAAGIARKLDGISRGIQHLRGDAESRLERSVADANAHLHTVQSLNARIAEARNLGHPTAAFEDQRRVVLDRLADLIPIRLADRDNGAVAIYTTGGATLLDGRPAKLAFTAANAVMPHMTADNGLLNRLSLDGRPISASGQSSPIAGGRIAGLLDLRDRLAVDAQTQIDAVARDLVIRFQDPALDPTRAPGDPGLFTDGGAAFDPTDEIGLAQRIGLNPRVDPGAGGAPWRLRDGLDAAAPGDAGNAALLNDLAAALGRTGTLASGDLGATGRNLSGHVSALVARVGQDRLASDQNVAFAAAHQSGLLEAEQAMGVDTDAEMQHLLLVEQAYNANARVIAVMGDLIDALLGI